MERQWTGVAAEGGLQPRGRGPLARRLCRVRGLLAVERGHERREAVALYRAQGAHDGRRCGRLADLTRQYI